MFHEIFLHGQTASSFGLDTDGRMVSFTTPALNPTMVAIERMLPGDEMVRIEGNELVTFESRSAHPLAMVNDNMTWRKSLLIKRTHRIKNVSSYWREIRRYITVGSHMRVQRLGDGNFDFLVEVTHVDGKKTFLPGIPFSGAEPVGDDE